MSHSAISASGSAASCDNTKAASISRDSWRYPSMHSRHIDDRAGGSGSIAIPPVPARSRSRSGEDVIGHPLILGDEALCLQVEHRSIAAALFHQLVVRAELDDTAVLEHADAVSPAHGGEAV